MKIIDLLLRLFKKNKEKHDFKVPKSVQDTIPIKRIYEDGIFQVDNDKYSRTYVFTDINYAVASKDDKESMFLDYSEILNSLDSGADIKITIMNIPQDTNLYKLMTTKPKDREFNYEESN